MIIAAFAAIPGLKSILEYEHRCHEAADVVGDIQTGDRERNFSDDFRSLCVKISTARSVRITLSAIVLIITPPRSLWSIPLRH